MRKNLLILFAFCCLAIACDDDAEKITLLNVNVIDPIHTNARTWLYATDANGRVLTTHEITTKGELTLRGATSGQRVDIGYAMMYSSLPGDKKNWYIFHFKDIELGTSVEVGRILPASTSTGTARVLVTNYNEPVSALRNLVFSVAFSGGIKSIKSENNIVDAELILGNGMSEVLITGLRGNTPVYFRKENVAPGAIVEADFSTFTPMENIQALNFKGFTSTAGFRQAEPHSYYYNFENTRVTDGVATTGLLAYVPGYDDYQTFISNTEQSNGVSMRSFLRRGNPVTSFAFPDVGISVNDQSVASFNADISIPYTYKISTFYFTEGGQQVSLAVYSNSEGSTSFNDFPDELKKADPSLKVGDLSYTSVKFVSADNTYTIADELKVILSNTSQKGPFQIYSHTHFKFE